MMAFPPTGGMAASHTPSTATSHTNPATAPLEPTLLPGDLLVMGGMVWGIAQARPERDAVLMTQMRPLQDLLQVDHTIHNVPRVLLAALIKGGAAQHYRRISDEPGIAPSNRTRADAVAHYEAMARMAEAGSTHAKGWVERNHADKPQG